MQNYNIYLNSDNYFISYCINDNKIIKKYDRDTTDHIVPFNQHNIEVCERQLQKELYKVPKQIKSEIKNLTIYSLALLPLTISLGITGHYVLGAFELIILLKNLTFLRIDQFILKDANLSIFCLENIDRIKTITTNNIHHHLPLSKAGIEVLDSKEGLTYNNIHQCIYDDLKILKKTINDYCGD